MPAPIVNGGGDRFWKWKEFKLSRARDLDLDHGSGHTAYRRASLIDLYLYTKFHSNRRNFLWTDGRTYGHTDGHFSASLILLGRLLEVDLKTAQRDANTACALAVVRFGHRPPVVNTQTHRQDRLQYTAPQLASAQCKDSSDNKHSGRKTKRWSVTNVFLDSTSRRFGLVYCLMALSAQTRYIVPYKYEIYQVGTWHTFHKTMKQYNKPRES